MADDPLAQAVARYNESVIFEGGKPTNGVYFAIDPDGDWVRYEDYAKLAAALHAAREEVAALRMLDSANASFLRAYRVGGRPSEKAFREHERATKKLAAIDAARAANQEGDFRIANGGADG